MSKSAKADDSVAVSEKEGTGMAVSPQKVNEEGDGDVVGSLAAALPQTKRDELALELQEALYQIEQGFGELTSPTKIYEMDQVFWVIDAITIHDYVDPSTGEVKTKHIFRLEFESGNVVTTMQGDARPRSILAGAFIKARALGGRIKAGPYKYYKKRILNQIEPALIFQQQPGFEARAR